MSEVSSEMFQAIRQFGCHPGSNDPVRGTIAVLMLLPVLLLCSFAIRAAPEAIEDYRIGPGDVVAIEVFGEEDLSPELKVDRRGEIAYPFLGRLRVAGLTTLELAEKILDGLKGPYLIDPTVNVVVAEYRPFYISGEVRSPGGYPFEPGMTVRKAISLAGGLTDRASTRKIFVQHENARSEEERIRLELDDLIRPGDVVSIEESFF